MRQIAEDVPGDGRWGAAEWLLLLVLAAVQFTHVLDFMIMMPLGPRAYLRELAITPQQFGVLVAAYAFSACLSGLVAAAVIDRFDRKTALLFLAAGFTLGTLLCAVAPGYVTLVVGRCVAGFFGGILGALNLAIIGDAFPEWQRGLATGVIMSAFSVATIVGVPAGLFLASRFATWMPFAVLAGLSTAMMVLAALALPPLRQHLGHDRDLLASNWKVLMHPAHLRAYALMVCLVLGMFTIVPYLATFLVVNVGLAEDNLWVMYLCGGLGTLMTMSLFGRLADHFGKLPVFRIMALLTAVLVMVLTTLGQTPIVMILTITTAFMIVSSGRMVPAMAMITSSARPAYRGSFMSIISSVQQAAAGLASLVAGVILTQPVKDGPLVGFPIVGLLACVTTLLTLWVAGYVRPDAATPAVPDLSVASVPAADAATAITAEAVLTGVLPSPEAIQKAS